MKKKDLIHRFVCIQSHLSHLSPLLCSFTKYLSFCKRPWACLQKHILHLNADNVSICMGLHITLESISAAHLNLTLTGAKGNHTESVSELSEIWTLWGGHLTVTLMMHHCQADGMTRHSFRSETVARRNPLQVDECLHSLTFIFSNCDLKNKILPDQSSLNDFKVKKGLCKKGNSVNRLCV